MRDFNTETELNDEKIAECAESYKSTLNFLKRLEGLGKAFQDGFREGMENEIKHPQEDDMGR